MEFTPSVTRRLALAQDLDETLAEAQPVALAALDEFLNPVMTPEESSAASITLDLYRRKLAWVSDHLAVAERRYLTGLEHAAELCGVRDSITTSLAKKLVNLHRTLRGPLGKDELTLLGFAGKTARRPKAVLKQSREVAKAIDQVEAEITSADWEDLKVWAGKQAADMLPEIKRLSGVLQEIDRQRRETKVLSTARKQAVEAFDHDYMIVGQTAEALLRSAGLDPQADRIHPSTRQLDRKSDEQAADGSL